MNSEFGKLSIDLAGPVGICQRACGAGVENVADRKVDSVQGDPCPIGGELSDADDVRRLEILDGLPERFVTGVEEGFSLISRQLVGG